MPPVTLNGIAFSGTVYDAETTPRAPQEITPSPQKAGVVLTAADGTERIVLRNSGTPREHFELTWSRVPSATRNAVRTVFDLSATFTAVLPSGTYSVQCRLDDYRERINIIAPGGTEYYDVSLQIHQT